jgi:hypothetical protein
VRQNSLRFGSGLSDHVFKIQTLKVFEAFRVFDSNKSGGGVR